MTDGNSFVRPTRVPRAYEELAGQIRQRVLSGDLQEGDRLPSESAIAREAEVSRSTVREALRKLEEAGFIGRQSPKIFVVRHRPGEEATREFSRAMRRSNVTTNDLYDAMLVIEPEMARLATLRATSEGIERLKANLAAQERSLTDYAEWCRLDEEFHLTIAEMSDNPALIIARAPIMEMLLPVFHRYSDGKVVAPRSLAFHFRIVEEIEDGDPEAAALMMKKHVRSARTPRNSVGLDFDRPIPELLMVNDGKL